ncbi:MAG: protein translocase subunit SecF [Clostridia bacterium]|nr:protein translocase subunit SecF [Clostridia bacterium]
MKKIKDMNFKIVEWFKYFGSFAVALILTGIILLLTVGMNIGLDFAGGATVNVTLGEHFVINEGDKEGVKQEILDLIKNKGFIIGSERWAGEDNNVLEIGIEYGEKESGDDEEYQQKFLESIQGTEGGNFEDGLLFEISELVKVKDPTFVKDDCSSQIVGASTARTLLKNAIIASSVAVVIMLIYIIMRFTLSSGLSAIIALCHDVFIMITLCTIFKVKINTTFIAAVITVIGYSINATIVIFDRIRELQKLNSLKDASDSEIANLAVKNTLTRTIFTTLTTLIVIVVLAILCQIMGVTTMAEFALPIMFGLIAGTYSSIFLASSLWVYLRKLGAKIKKTKKA